jgi:hypothetical protein
MAEYIAKGDNRFHSLLERERILGVEPKVCECVYGKGVNTRGVDRKVCVERE